MDSNTLTKMAYKGAIGIAFSALLGYIVKLEHAIDERIDSRYEKESEESEEDSTD